LSTPAVPVVMVTGMLLFFAFAGFSTSWALWMSEQFGLGTLEIGFVATRISLAELVGVVFSLLFIDRIGKRIMVRSGFLLAIILFLAWLWLPPVRWLSQIILLLLGGVLETTIVSYFPFISDLLPKARATLFSLAVLGISVGLALAPPVTLYLWEQFGQEAIVILMVLVLFVALLLTGSQALKNST
ncbi:MAG: MFS transporter, partial [Chloroflexota bacterium]